MEIGEEGVGAEEQRAPDMPPKQVPPEAAEVLAQPSAGEAAEPEPSLEESRALTLSQQKEQAQEGEHPGPEPWGQEPALEAEELLPSAASAGEAPWEKAGAVIKVFLQPC